MKEGIHPEYKNISVSCTCGNKFETRSTCGDLLLETCSQCHPFYTGKQRSVKTGGRLSDFERRYGSLPLSTGTADK